MSNAIEAAGPPASLVNTANLVYALHTLSLIIGVTTAATVVGAFVFGIPSIIAVVINYLKRADASKTFLESHFRWQIRTFWFALLWSLVSMALIATVIGLPLGLMLFFGTGVWVIYRIARGWLALRNLKAMYSS